MPSPEMVRTDTHPFAPYVRILGRGPGRSRSLTRDEARKALGLVLSGDVEPEQIGAFLMLLRYRGEAPDEMAGLVEAARDASNLPWNLGAPIDLDWPSYADGRTRGEPFYLLSALLLAQAGLRVVMHGPLHGPGREALRAALAELNLPQAATREIATAALATNNFVYLPTETLAPGLARLLALRGVLGLRSPINTVGRLLNPTDAAHGVDGVFHPAYIALHLDTARLLGRPDLAVLKGGGGEAEWTGAKSLLVNHLSGDPVTWPALAPPPPIPGLTAAALWRRETDDPAAANTVIATAAVALHAAGAAQTPEAALAQCRTLWACRDGSFANKLT